MKKYFKIFCVTLVLLSGIFSSGCTTRKYKNPYEHQPLLGLDKRAKAETIIRSFAKGLWVDFKWDIDIFNTKDFHEVISTCEKYLESNGFEAESINIRWDEIDNKAYPWEYWTIRSSRNGEHSQGKSSSRNVECFAKLHIIACLKPLVVVSLDHPVNKYRLNSGAFNGFSAYVKSGDHGEIFIMGGEETVLDEISGELITKKSSFLMTDPEGIEFDASNPDHSGYYWQTCRGYGYGTRIPYKKDITWFSPELDVLPTAPEFISEDVRRIKVPWGWLVLEHKGDEWIVKGVKE